MRWQSARSFVERTRRPRCANCCLVPGERRGCSRLVVQDWFTNGTAPWLRVCAHAHALCSAWLTHKHTHTHSLSLSLSLSHTHRCGTEITRYSAVVTDKDSDLLAVHLSPEGAAALHAYGQSGETAPALPTHSVPHELLQLLDRSGFLSLHTHTHTHTDRKSTRLNSSHFQGSRMPSSA